MDNFIWQFHCLNMVKMQDVNSSYLKDTGITSPIGPLLRSYAPGIKQGLTSGLISFI